MFSNFVLLKRGWMSDLKGIRGLGLHFGLSCHPEREWAPWCVCVAEADSRQALVGGRPAAGFTMVVRAVGSSANEASR